MSCHICTSANHSFLACLSFDPVNNTRPTRTPPGRPTATPTPTNCRGCRVVSTSWETQSDSRTLWKVLKEPCPVHQPQPDSYADFPPPPPSLFGNIFMTALSSSSASPPLVSSSPHDSLPPPVSPSPHESPQAASTTTRKNNQPYRKKETVDEAILVYTSLRQRLSLGETLTKALGKPESATQPFNASTAL